MKCIDLHKGLMMLMAINLCHGKIEIGQYLKTCDRASPDANDCLMESIQEGIRIMCDGIPDLGVPPLDPYNQKDIKVEYKKNQIVGNVLVSDVVVHGLKGAKVHDVRLRADEDIFHLEVDLTSPRVFVSGRYHGDGRYNAIRVNTTGDFNSTMRHLVYTWKIDAVPTKRGNETYFKVTSFYMRPDIGDLKLHAGNVFPDDPQLTEQANQFVNQNWKLFYRELLPYAQANWGKSGVKVANKIFLKVPFEQLFPTTSKRDD